mmetsp:Transcript_37114/g.59649  ORF Transcript_37114/g.59649 Transcript_37114/m.59649 type:complete len:306 (+) Transcript_37114:661-1578(+)
MVQTFCIDARTKIVSCSRAARVSDTTTLRSEAHSMRGGAAACCATQLENSCGVLERSARLDQELSLAINDTSSITSSAAKSPEDWKMMVETNVAECLTQLSQNVDALTSMRTLPSFNTLQDVCAEWNNDAIVGALSDLLEVAVNAYVAAHTAIFKEECNVGEVPFSVAREKLGLACAAADALAVRELVRTAGLLSDHLIKSPSGETLANKVHENERKKTCWLICESQSSLSRRSSSSYSERECQYSTYRSQTTSRSRQLKICQRLGTAWPPATIPYSCITLGTNTHLSLHYSAASRTASSSFATA